MNFNDFLNEGYKVAVRNITESNSVDETHIQKLMMFKGDVDKILSYIDENTPKKFKRNKEAKQVCKSKINEH